MAPQFQTPEISLSVTTAGGGANQSPTVFFDNDDYLDYIDMCRREWKATPPKTNYTAKQWKELYPELGGDFDRILLKKEIEIELLRKKIKETLKMILVLPEPHKMIMTEWVRATLGEKLNKLSKDIKWFRLGKITTVTNNGLSEEQIQQAREVPIEDLINTKKVNKSWGCPFHEDSTPSFHIYPDNGWHCFGCQAHGSNAIDYVMKLNKLDFKDAVNYLIGK